jgi:hypothetical protein
MIRVVSSAIVLLVLLTVCGRGSAQGKEHVSAEQRHFSAEDAGVQRPIPLPDDVLAILSKDELVRDVLEDENPPEGQLPQAWFSVSTIHLSSKDINDLVVVGKGPLRGANVITFWVISSTPHGHELVLNAPAHDLIVKNTSWKGYRQIEMSGETAVVYTSVLFRWDGRKYAKYRVKSNNIR